MPFQSTPATCSVFYIYMYIYICVCVYLCIFLYLPAYVIMRVKDLAILRYRNGVNLKCSFEARNYVQQLYAQNARYCIYICNPI